MWTKRSRAGALCVLLALPFSAGAQPLDLFVPIETKAASLAAASSGERRREVSIPAGRIETLVQTAARPVSSVRFALLADTAASFETESVVPGPLADSWVWRGRDPDDPASSAVLLVRDNRITGNLRTRNGFFEVRHVEGDRHAVREAAPLGPFSPDDEILPPVPLSPRKQARPPAPKLAGGAPVIDLLVVYTPNARRSLGGSQSIQDSIGLGVAETNASFANSLIDAELRLAAAVEVDLQLGKPEEATGDYLDRIRNQGESAGTILNNLRAYYGADLVSVWISPAPCAPGSQQPCWAGMGYVLTSDNIFVDEFAYTLVDAAVALGPNYAFTHEIGHNLGCVHDRLNTGLTGWFPYSYGYQQTAQSPQFATMMAYFANGCGGCVKINYWSNPQVLYPPGVGGSPTGRPANGSNSADNALTINQTAPVIAAFRPATFPPPNQPPTADTQNLTTPRGVSLPITLTGSDSEMQPLLFDVTLAPAHGTVTGTAPHLTYTPAAGYVGPDQLRFQVSDLHGGFAQAFINVTVESRSTGAIGVYRAGAWKLDSNFSGAFESAADFQSNFGWAGAAPIRGDWNGDDRDEIGVFSNGFWYLDYDGNGVWDGGAADKQFQFGWSGVTPVIGDWNGDGRDTIGIFMNGFWYLDADGDGIWDGPEIDIQAQFGWNGVTPLVGDWNGDGRAKIGIYIDGFWYLDYDGSAAWDGPGVDRQAEFGWAGVTPLTGDWSGDGRDTIGVYANGFWYLDADGNGAWSGPAIDIQAQFGFAGAAPVLGDWSSTGSDKIGIFVNGVWYLDYDGSAGWDNGVQDKAYSFGQSGDTPMAGRW